MCVCCSVCQRQEAALHPVPTGLGITKMCRRQTSLSETELVRLNIDHVKDNLRNNKAIIKR